MTILSEKRLADSEALADLLVARQPICDEQMEVVAYELLFRDQHSATHAKIVDANDATAKVILNSVLEIGLDNIVGQLPAFINLTRSFILGRYQLPLPTHRVILEVLEDMIVDEELIKGLRLLKEQGYTIALDDFLYAPGHEALIGIADIVKLDLMALNGDELARHADILRRHPVKLLAEKVEDQQSFERCRSLGFDYYQGFFFAEPQTIAAPRSLVSRPSALISLANIMDPGTRVDEITAILDKDVALGYRIINAINCGYCALPKRIDSVAEALAALGLSGLRNLGGVLILAGVERKPRYLVQTLLTRAKMAERLAALSQREHIEDFFTAGMLSVLPPLLDLPIDEALQGLRIKASVRAALLDRQGPVAEVIDCVLSYERGEWDKLHYLSLNTTQIRRAYLHAITWSNEIYRDLMH